MEEDPFNEMITQMVIKDEDEDEEDNIEFQMMIGQSTSLVGNMRLGSSSTRQYKDRGRENPRLSLLCQVSHFPFVWNLNLLLSLLPCEVSSFSFVWNLVGK
ncbi:Uncharacterized protein Fot_11879 [Forsythia ovata]|uniref:Uncharacterized protein n=1 Tax=Forsythia ovata TaxID=205694 RepID=A0ABD1WKY2_9LAMI